MVMAKTASLNATNRPVSRYTEGESAPALPPGARAIASQRTERITEDTTPVALRRGGRGCIAARAASTAATLNCSLGARKAVRGAILARDSNELYAAYTLIRDPHMNDPGRTR
jgi:hypothetical protein